MPVSMGIIYNEYTVRVERVIEDFLRGLLAYSLYSFETSMGCQKSASFGLCDKNVGFIGLSLYVHILTRGDAASH